jgi:hypothetical protein
MTTLLVAASTSGAGPGCTGGIGGAADEGEDPSTEPGEARRADPAPAPATAPTPGRPPAATAPATDLGALGAKVPAGTPMFRNLSNREYLNAVSDLIGARLPLQLIADWNPTTQFAGFDAIAWTNYDTKSVRDRVDALEPILDQAVQSPKVMTCAVTAASGLPYGGCAKSVLEPFAHRAFRRPLTAAEIQQLTASYTAAVSLAQTALTDPAAIFKDAIRVALGTILLAPQFITKAESPPSATFRGERALDAYELASRLSFMLLNSLPDDELWAAAKSGALASDPKALPAQAARLLTARTDAFTQTFMGQWLGFRPLDSAAAGSIENAMWNETWRTLQQVVKDDLPVPTLIKPGFTFLNQQIAKHYGITATLTSSFARFATPDRGGILQQGSWLTLSSTRLKTDPIHRGRLVQDSLLCKDIPMPDAALADEIAAAQAKLPATATPKQQLEAHRKAGPACFGCHQYMDPIGIGLEGFDQLGKVRTVYADTGKPVETDSTLLGKPFANFAEMNQLIHEMPEFTRCTARRLAVFALGRIVEEDAPGDVALLDYLSFAERGQPPTLRAMTLRLVQSRAFQRVVH